MPNSQTPPSELDAKTALLEEHRLLSTVDVPIVTVSATTHQELQDHFHDSFPQEEVIFSRAHYSMALGVLVEAIAQNLSAWLVDPTNYVTAKDWPKILMTEAMGQLIARNELLKDIKNRFDALTRNSLPLTRAIESPLQYLAQSIKRPILSFHYEAGNLLAQQGHTVIQVITDPHVRPLYLQALKHRSDRGHDPNLYFCVFDQATKTDFLLLAQDLQKRIDPDRIVVTGPPIDPRIIAAKDKKTIKPHNPLRLAITTSGLGTNKTDIKNLLNQLSRFCFTGSKTCTQLFLYAGTHPDFLHLYQEFAAHNGLDISPIQDKDALLRIGYSDSLVEANEILIDHVFPWADGVITKPSGDMAYDAAASGSFLLFLEPWGEWEEAIRERFLHLDIGKDLQLDDLENELAKLASPFWENNSWFHAAKKKAHHSPDLYLQGAHNILKLYRRISNTPNESC